MTALSDLTKKNDSKMIIRTKAHLQTRSRILQRRMCRPRRLRVHEQHSDEACETRVCVPDGKRSRTCSWASDSVRSRGVGGETRRVRMAWKINEAHTAVNPHQRR